MVVAPFGLRLKNLYFAVIIYEAQFDQFLVHQNQTWLNVVPRQVDVLHQSKKTDFCRSFYFLVEDRGLERICVKPASGQVLLQTESSPLVMFLADCLPSPYNRRLLRSNMTDLCPS